MDWSVSVAISSSTRAEGKNSHRSTVYNNHHMRLRSSFCSSVNPSWSLKPLEYVLSTSSALVLSAASLCCSGGGVTGTSLPNLNSLASDQAASHQRSDAALYSLAEMTIARCIYVATSSSPLGTPATGKSQRSLHVYVFKDLRRTMSESWTGRPSILVCTPWVTL